MIVKKQIEIEISRTELTQIIIQHLKNKNVTIDSVYFNINGHNDEGDWRSEFPLTYKLDSVICKGVEK